MTRVLVVDDKDENLYYLQVLLSANGYTVECAHHGAEALALARATPPDLVVSDLLMPVMDGFSLLRHWKEDATLRHAPFIVFAATYMDPGDEKLARNLGADAFILKPAEPDELLARIREVLDRAAASMPALPKQHFGDEDELREVYGDALIGKLEEKTRKLEQANRALELDIAERKVTEERLRLLSSAVLQARDSIMITDANLASPGPTTIFVNPAFTLMTGYTAEEAIGRSPRILQGPRTDQALMTRLRDTLEQGGVFEGETINYRKDGAPYHQEWHIAPIRNGREDITHYVAIQRDITARKDAEELVRESQTRLALATEAARIGIWDWDLLTKAMLWDAQMHSMYGITTDLAEGAYDSWLSALHPDDYARVMFETAAALDGSREFHMEFRIVCPDSAIRVIEAHATVFRDAEGTPTRMIGVNWDITDRREHERRVVEQAELIDQANDAFVVRDLEHRVVFWSKGAERLYGFSAGEAAGRILNELVRPDSAVFHEALAAVLEHGVWSGEIAEVTKSGAAIVVASRWTLLRDADGQPKSILAITTDVTERKQLERQFLRAQRLESIGTLAGGIAHDLNNALAPMIMSLELLKMTFTDDDSLALIDTLASSAHHGADMVRQLLSFARGVEGERVEVQVGHLLHEVEKIARDTFPKSIVVRTSVAADLWAMRGDPTQVHQVLMNLCVNARDAMPFGGALSLSAANATLDAQLTATNPRALAGPFVVIRVTDTGTGMPPELLEQIFDPFFTTKEIGMGTGLGLSTSLAIIKSHGGFLRVESEPGKGTTFTLYFPAHASLANGPVPEKPAQKRGNNELILVVDDDASVRHVIEQTLKAFGYRVLVADDGADALSVYATRGAEISVVVTDMMMPVMDGIAMIRVLRKLNPDVRIIATSGLLTSADTARAASLGVKSFLSKPFTTETLLNALRTCLARPSAP